MKSSCSLKFLRCTVHREESNWNMSQVREHEGGMSIVEGSELLYLDNNILVWISTGNRDVWDTYSRVTQISSNNVISCIYSTNINTGPTCGSEILTKMTCLECNLWQNRWTNLIHGSDSDERPPLWSSGRSSWVQIQRSGFDSRRYKIF
jgi:hypothetical protein